MLLAQKEDLSSVNEALNEYYIEEEDYECLRQSIDDFENFDQVALAQRVEKHELLEFRWVFPIRDVKLFTQVARRRIAAYLYKRNKRWEQSIRLSKDDKMYKDAIDTAQTSNDRKLAEDLLSFFVEARDKACFTCTLRDCAAF
jgi:clathrin heavy chain